MGVEETSFLFQDFSIFSVKFCKIVNMKSNFLEYFLEDFDWNLNKNTGKFGKLLGFCLQKYEKNFLGRILLLLVVNFLEFLVFFLLFMLILQILFDFYLVTYCYSKFSLGEFGFYCFNFKVNKLIFCQMLSFCK